jgi:hypothetical protein
LPTETAELGFEIVVWLILGVVLIASTINTGSYLLKFNTKLQLTYVTESIIETINIVGSRKVQVYIELPGVTGRTNYTVHIQGKMVTAKTDELAIVQTAMYYVQECTLHSGRSYAATLQEGQVVFREGAP